MASLPSPPSPAHQHSDTIFGQSARLCAPSHLRHVCTLPHLPRHSTTLSRSDGVAAFCPLPLARSPRLPSLPLSLPLIPSLPFPFFFCALYHSQLGSALEDLDLRRVATA